MSNESPSPDFLIMPALLRHARAAYGKAMRQALEIGGFDDIPENGIYVIGGLAMGAGGVPMRQLAKELGITKQAAGQLVDTLVLRGYIDRKVDAQDRRKMAIALTERGRGAAGVLEAVREKIDGELLARVGQDNLMRTRRTLAALVELGRQLESESISNASSVEPRGSQGANLTR